MQTINQSIQEPINTTVTINEQGLFVPKELLQNLGWQLDSKIKVMQSHADLVLSLVSNTTVNTITTSNITVSATENEQKTKDKALLDKAFGMLTVKPKNIPEGSLFDFDVAEHITLFDETD